MAIDRWLPVGHPLPGGDTCGKALHGAEGWQLVQTQGAGRALLAREALHQRWVDAGIVSAGEFEPIAFGAERCLAATSPAGQELSPLAECRSPGNKAQMLAFALAMKATRRSDAEAPLHDSIYFQRLGRLLPTWGEGPAVDDDLVLGAFLTGGARVSARSPQRLQRMLSWLGADALGEVVGAAGLGPVARPDGDAAGSSRVADRTAGLAEAADERPPEPRPGMSPLEQGKPFELAGRPALETFFNEHVIDIVRHKARYAALGVGFPSAIVLHGPPGCGKTHAVECLVEHLGWPCWRVEASSVASPYIHETSKKVAEVFDRAMKNAPAVVVIDEMESFLADREAGSGSSHHRVEEVAEFLRRIPEAGRNEVLVIGMTNRIEMIDPAIMRRGRFDHVVAVEPPTRDEVAALLRRLLAALPVDEGIDVDVLASPLVGRPLSDVTFVVREGARLCARAGLERLQAAHLKAALASADARDGAGPGRRIGFL